MFKTLLISAVFSALTLPALLQNANAAPSSKAAQTTAAPTVLDSNFIKEKLGRTLGLSILTVEETPMPGIALVVSNKDLFYTTYDGDYLIKGNVYSLAGEFANLTENTLIDIRLKGVERFKDDAIVYKAKDEKYVITVFTDISCGYCRKMHAEMDEYNARGITVRYLAYPRAGVQDRAGNTTKSFSDLRSVWCSENPAEALTQAKSGKAVPNKVCEAPIEAQYSFGGLIGVTGTPAIIFPNGQMGPGYVPADKLEGMLKSL